MTNDEVLNLPGRDNPVLCADGLFGMLLIYPGKDGLCGVQVPGAECHRWIPAADLTTTDGGALRESGSPQWPPGTDDPTQILSQLDWVSRGGSCLWTVG